jgi:hypothetical protein
MECEVEDGGCGEYYAVFWNLKLTAKTFPIGGTTREISTKGDEQNVAGCQRI